MTGYGVYCIVVDMAWDAVHVHVVFDVLRAATGPRSSVSVFNGGMVSAVSCLDPLTPLSRFARHSAERISDDPRFQAGTEYYRTGS